MDKGVTVEQKKKIRLSESITWLPCLDFRAGFELVSKLVSLNFTFRKRGYQAKAIGAIIILSNLEGLLKRRTRTNSVNRDDRYVELSASFFSSTILLFMVYTFAMVVQWQLEHSFGG